MRTRASRRTIARACLLGALLLAACPSTTVYRTADPVPPGRWQLAAATGIGGMRDTEQESRIPTGHLELAARRGIRPDLDLGLKLYTIGVEASATWRFRRSPTWSWALAPSLGGARTRESGVITDAIHLFAGGAVIASRKLSRRWHLGLGPLAGWGLYWPETGGHATGAWLGGFINADARISASWHLVPEIGAYRVITGEVPVHGGALWAGLGVRWNL